MPSCSGLISAHKSRMSEWHQEGVANVIGPPVANGSYESVFNSSSDPSPKSASRTWGSTLGLEVRIYLEPNQITTPIEQRVSFLRGIVLPTTTCPSCRTMRPIHQISQVMYGPTKMVLNWVLMCKKLSYHTPEMKGLILSQIMQKIASLSDPWHQYYWPDLQMIWPLICVYTSMMSYL